jgi:CHAT domain-containing protein/Tfp pilus assembly protein PilF
LAVGAGLYVRGVVEKDDLNADFTVFGPGSDRLLEKPARGYGPLPFSFVTHSAGSYRLELASIERETSPRRFSIKIEEVRPATDDDAAADAAERLYAEAEGLRATWREKALRSALSKYEAAAEQWRAASHTAEAGGAFEAAGDVDFILGDYAEARSQYRAALDARHAAGDSRGELEALNNVGYAEVYLGLIEQAARSIEGVLRATGREGEGRDRLAAQALNNLGEVEYTRGALVAARGHFQDALATWEASSDRGGQALAHLNLGYTYADSGDLIEGQNHFERALALARDKGDRRLEALSMTGAGTVYAFRGRQRLALDSHTGALEILRAIGDRQGSGVALNSIGQSYEDSKDTGLALDYYLQALDNFVLSGNRDTESVTRFYLGRVYDELGDEARSLEYYGQAIRLCHEMGKPRMEAYASLGVAMVRATRGELSPSLALMKSAGAIFKAIRDSRGQALALNGRGYVLQRQGDVRAALAAYRGALPLSRAAGDLYVEAATLYNVMRAERDLGRLEDALKNIEASLRISESLRTNAATQELRTSFFASVHERYESYVDLLMQMHWREPAAGYDVRALLASEWARARSLRELLGESRVDISRGVAPDLLERERSLRDVLAAKVEYQVRLQSGGAAAEASKVEDEIRELLARYEDVRAQIRTRSPSYALLTQPQPLRLEELQRELDDGDTLLLEYQLGEPRSYVWAVTKNSVTGRELPGRTEIEEAARNFYELLTARRPRRDEPDETRRARVAEVEARYGDEPARLSRLILEPVAARLGTKRLLVVAEGALQTIPIDALPLPPASAPDSSGETPPLLLSRNEVINLPSASTLAQLRLLHAPDASGPGEQIAVLADPVFEVNDPRVRRATGGAAPPAPQDAAPEPEWRDLTRLPDSSVEAERIREAAPAGAVKVLKGFDATRGLVVGGGLNSYGVLHFATHGIINSHKPELSGILLTAVDERGTPVNGYLQLHDVYTLDLRARLVVLSACDMALGKEIRGEGLIGLTRGFMYAGAETVVASLWRVDDRATAELMRHFYEGMLREGLAPSAALRRAKLKVYEQPEWRSPYFWAAFTLQGEYRTPVRVVAGPRRWRGLAAAAGLALALGLALFFYRRRLFVSAKA